MAVIFQLCEVVFFCFCVSVTWHLDFWCRVDPVFTADMATLHRLQPQCDPAVMTDEYFVPLRVHHIISWETLYNSSHLSQQWPRSSAPTLCCVAQPSPFVCISVQKQLHWWISPISTGAWQDVYVIIPEQNSLVAAWVLTMVLKSAVVITRLHTVYNNATQ